MEKTLSSSGLPKNKPRDGVVLQVHHTLNSQNGELRRICFLCCSFDSDGERLAAADCRGNVFAVDLNNKKCWFVADLGSCHVLAYSPVRDIELIIGLSNSDIVIVNSELGTLVETLCGHSQPVTQLSFARKRFCLAASSEEAKIWDLTSNTQCRRLLLKKCAFMKMVRFVPVLDHVLAVYNDNSINIWNSDLFQCMKYISHTELDLPDISAIAFTINGRAMVLGGHSHSIVVYSLETWAVTKCIHIPQDIPGIKEMHFLPQPFDGGANKVLSFLSSDGTVHFLDVDLSLYFPKIILSTQGIRNFTCSVNGKYIGIVHKTGEIDVYASSVVLDVQAYLKNISEDVYNSFSSKNKNKHVIKLPHIKEIHRQFDSEVKETLTLSRLKTILCEFGEYPEAFRSLIWRTLLQLPNNYAHYADLLSRKYHPAYSYIEKVYPLKNSALLKALKRVLSCMAHWSPLFSEVSFLPELVFPFVKIFQNDPCICFEVILTITINWCQHWFEYFPFPPINLLAIIENVLNEHDPELLQLFCQAGINSQLYGWKLMEAAFSEVLPSKEWMQLWDHILSNEPSFFFMAVVAYNIVCRGTIISCKTLEDFKYFYHNQNPVDMRRFISKTYHLLENTREDIHPRQYLEKFTPLPSRGYPVFNKYPKILINKQVSTIEKIQTEEDDVKKKLLIALNMKVQQERKFMDEATSAIHTDRLSCIENLYQDTLQNKQNRLVALQEKVLALQTKLQNKQLDLMDVANATFSKHESQKFQKSLENSLDDTTLKKLEQENDIRKSNENIGFYKVKSSDCKKNSNEFLPTSYSESLEAGYHYIQEEYQSISTELKKLYSEIIPEYNQDGVQGTQLASVDELLNMIHQDLHKERLSQNYPEKLDSKAEQLMMRINNLKQKADTLLKNFKLISTAENARNLSKDNKTTENELNLTQNMMNSKSKSGKKNSGGSKGLHEAKALSSHKENLALRRSMEIRKRLS